MPYPQVETPLSPREASVVDSDEAVMSQAATLLLVGFQLRRQTVKGETRTVPSASEGEDLAPFRMPEWAYSGERWQPSEVRRHLRKTHSLTVPKKAEPTEVWGQVGQRYPDVLSRYMDQPDAMNAAALFEASLAHHHELVRVCAAAAYFPLSRDPRRLIRVLAAGAASDDQLVRDVAATALSRISAGNRSLSALTRKPRGKPPAKEPSETSVLIHGTWARNSSWWQPPDGDFFKYLHTEAGISDLYGGGDRFAWTGGYSREDRAIAAEDLIRWVGSHHQPADPNLLLMGHSHGANVALLASQSLSGINKLVLLSCPVHLPEYQPNFANVQKVISFRVRLDLVILADFGGQRFPSSLGIQETVLPVWFDHFATHNPDVWRKNNLPAKL